MLCLNLGLQSSIEPLGDIIPITPGDYSIRQHLMRSRPPTFVDMDMLYANRKQPNIYCFDQKGTWIKEVKC
jgi:hypothetical protein